MRVYFHRLPASAPATTLRALPTPCRHRRRTEDAHHAVGETTPQTLDSHALGGSCASASTVDADHAPAQQCRPVTLCLADQPTCTVGAHSSTLRLTCTLESTLEVLAPFQLEHMCRCPELVPELHSAALQSIDTLPLWDLSAPPTCLTIYTDGSFSSHLSQSSWAVAITGHLRGTSVFVGYLSSPLYDAEHPLSFGRGADAFTAELTALTVALAICAGIDGTQCHLVGDCTSALDIAKVEACTKNRTPIEQAMIDLQRIARARGNSISFEHVKSHEGTPGNEFVDSAAKAAIHHGHFKAPNLSLFSDWVRSYRFSSAWWIFSGLHQTGELPGLDEQGATLGDAHVPLPPLHSVAALPGIPVPLTVGPDTNEADASWHLRLSTYNVNTLKREADRQQLDRMLSANQVHIAGIQETRCFPAARFCTAHYQCIASADQRGNLGCQLWVSAKQPVATRCDGHSVFLEPRAATILVSTTRILATCVPAGKLLFGIIVAHAPIEAATEDEKNKWWDCLRSTARQLPRRAIPILLIDANARYTALPSSAQVHLAHPDGDNADRLQFFDSENGLHSTSLFDGDGHRSVTWTSPTGHNTQLDYIFLPEALATHSTTLGAPISAYEHAGIDHCPLLAELMWRQPTKGTRSFPRWDRKKLQSDAGKRILQEIHQSTPQVPWTYHVEDHLQIINNHLYAGLCLHFSNGNQRPRQTHISDEKWHSIRLRRQVRRLSARSRNLRRREILMAATKAWRHMCDRQQSTNASLEKTRRKLARAHLNEARLGKLIKSLTCLTSKLAAKDAAVHARTVLAASRGEGPSSLFRALRDVLKTGRRYRPPLVLPALSIDGEVVADPCEVQDCLTRHFAEPEHGTTVAVQNVVAHGSRADWHANTVELQDLPSVSAIALSFLSMKDNKAAGISSIRSEVYRYAALDAATSHAVLYTKIIARRHWPSLWRGVLATAIPKPHKHGALLTSWRSIALAEAASKGIGRSVRQELVRKLATSATKGQHGSLPGEQIGIPSHHVLAFLQLAQLRNRSTAIVFLDGRSAYYATIREFLFSHTLDDREDLERLIQLLIPDETLHDQAIATLLGPGLLQAAGVQAGLVDFLRSHLSSTWFSLQPCPSVVQCTKSGTTPGSPLADILYQLVQTSYMRRITHELEEIGLRVRVSASCDPADAQGWADDIAVLMPLSEPTAVESNLRAAIPILDRGSRLMGVPLNYGVGKTEALISLRGPRSVSVRRALLTCDTPHLSIPIDGSEMANLRLVERYTHLGNVVSHSTSCLDDVRSKAAGAMPVLRRLQQTLLRNPELSSDEKVMLTGMLVVAKLEFGAGLWNPRTHSEREAVNTALARPWRAVCKRITGSSTKLLTDHEIYSILGVLTAAETLQVARVRQLLSVLDEGPGFLWQCLQSVQDWLQLACKDAVAILQADGKPVPPCLETTALQLSELVVSCTQLRNSLKRYRRHCLQHRSLTKQAALEKAASIARCEAAGGAVLVASQTPCGRHVCSYCPMRFASKANLAAHMSTVHQVSAIVSVATGTACNVCRTEWWTTHRLKEHLRRSSVCRDTYHNADLSSAMQHETVGTKKDKAFRPPAEVHGPLPWWATLRPPPLQQAADPANVLEQCQEAQGKLRKLAAEYSSCKFCEWAPKAFA